MNKQQIESKIRSLELQIKVLKEEVAKLTEEENGKTPSTFADLYGILEGKSSTSEEEIEAAKYRMNWPDDDKLGSS